MQKRAGAMTAENYYLISF